VLVGGVINYFSGAVEQEGKNGDGQANKGAHDGERAAADGADGQDCQSWAKAADQARGRECGREADELAQKEDRAYSRWSHVQFFFEKDIEEGISVIINYASDCLSKNHRIELRGLGSFSLRKRKPRFSRNPKTGDSVFIDSKYYLYFRPSKNLKTLVNE